MPAEDSHHLVIDLSVITQENLTEHTLVGKCPTGKTEGVMEEMDVASGNTDRDGFQTVRKKRKAASPEFRASSLRLREKSKGRAYAVN